MPVTTDCRGGRPPAWGCALPVPPTRLEARKRLLPARPLYDPDARGTGMGRALIEAVHAAAVAAGGPAVSWLARDFNATAQTLYDRIGTRSPFVKYNRRLSGRFRRGRAVCESCLSDKSNRLKIQTHRNPAHPPSVPARPGPKTARWTARCRPAPGAGLRSNAQQESGPIWPETRRAQRRDPSGARLYSRVQRQRKTHNPPSATLVPAFPDARPFGTCSKRIALD